MRKATQILIEESSIQLVEAGYNLTPAGLKFHSGRLWIGETTDGDLVTVRITDGVLSVHVFRNDYREEFISKKRKKP